MARQCFPVARSRNKSTAAATILRHANLNDVQRPRPSCSTSTPAGDQAAWRRNSGMAALPCPRLHGELPPPSGAESEEAPSATPSPPPPPTSVAPWRPCSGSPSRRCISDCPGGLLPPSRSTAAVFYPCGRHQIVMALFMASCFHSSSEEASNPYDSPCIGTPRSSWLDVMLPFRLLCPCRYRGLRSRCMVRLLILNVFLIECVYTCYCLIIDTIFLCARFYDCSH
ncbi:unnamed protein product [Urochloa humidicola]